MTSKLIDLGFYLDGDGYRKLHFKVPIDYIYDGMCVIGSPVLNSATYRVMLDELEEFISEVLNGSVGGIKFTKGRYHFIYGKVFLRSVIRTHLISNSSYTVNIYIPDKTLKYTGSIVKVKHSNNVISDGNEMTTDEVIDRYLEICGRSS